MDVDMLRIKASRTMISIAIAFYQETAVAAGEIFNFSDEFGGHKWIISLLTKADKPFYPLLNKEGWPTGRGGGW
jgi:hypothetical protein